MPDVVTTPELRAKSSGPVRADSGRIRWGITAILALHAGLLAYGAIVHSPAWDEMGHLPAGIAHWQSGVFDLYRVNPPLVRTWATALPYAAGTRLEFEGAAFHCPPWQRLEFNSGSAWMRTDGLGFLHTLQFARLCMIPISLFAGWMCFRVAREMYGVKSGFLALVLWCMSPLVIGHASLITPDIASAATAALAVWAISHWMRQPTWLGAILTGIALGLAWLTKFTNLLLGVVWLGALVYRLIQPGDRQPVRVRWCAQGAAMLVIALDVIACGYRFEHVGTRLGDFHFVSVALAGPRDVQTEAYGNRFSGTVWASLPVPLPENYLLGIDVQKRDFENKMMSYLRGEWRKGGWWYYYLYAFAVKEPVGTLLLLLLAVARLPFLPAAQRSASLIWLALPAVLFIAVVSSQTGFNHHLRYLLPAYPFLFVFASSCAVPLRGDRLSRGQTILATVLVLGTVVESLAVYPHSISFFNRLVGGPDNGPRHLHNSNVDWGQDLLGLAQWAETHPEARPLQVIFSGGFQSQDLPLWKGDVIHRELNNEEFAQLQAGTLRDRWIAISVGKMYDPPKDVDCYQFFREHPPDGKIGYSLYLYDLTKVQPMPSEQK